MKLRLILLSFFSGVLLALCYPPLRTGFVACFGLLPLFYISFYTNRPYFYGYIWGIGLCIVQLYWLVYATVFGTIGVILLVPVFYWVVIWFLKFGYDRINELVLISLPFFWAGYEYLRSLGQTGFPWGTIAYTQSYYLHLIQYASITGVYGVSFWLATVNVMIWFLIKRIKHKKDRLIIAVFILIIFAVPYIYGDWKLKENVNEYNKIKVAMIQPSVPPDVKWTKAYQDTNFSILLNMSEKALANNNPVLLIWPETATSNYLRYEDKYLEKIKTFTAEHNIPLLTGVLDSYRVKGKVRVFNSAFFFRPNDTKFESYNKLRLVPFSERVPFEEIFSFLERVNMGEADFYPGDEYTVFEFEIEDTEYENWKVLTSVLICWDSVFPDDARVFVKKGAEFLTIITNDSWFGVSPAPYHHAQIAVFRAIENRVGIARNANSGVSLFIDPFGRKYNETKIFTKQTIVGDVYLKKDHTFYTKYGDVFSWMYIIISLFFIGFLVSLKKIKKFKHNEISFNNSD